MYVDTCMYACVYIYIYIYIYVYEEFTVIIIIDIVIVFDEEVEAPRWGQIGTSLMGT